jgi:hypothetical protein
MVPSQEGKEESRLLNPKKLSPKLESVKRGMWPGVSHMFYLVEDFQPVPDR